MKNSWISAVDKCMLMKSIDEICQYLLEISEYYPWVKRFIPQIEECISSHQQCLSENQGLSQLSKVSLINLLYFINNLYSEHLTDKIELSIDRGFFTITLETTDKVLSFLFSDNVVYFSFVFSANDLVKISGTVKVKHAHDFEQVKKVLRISEF